jgi:hypothetical protein
MINDRFAKRAEQRSRSNQSKDILALPARNKIIEPFAEAVALRKRLPVVSHFEKVSFVYEVGSGFCPRSTPSRSFQTFGLLFRQLLKHGTHPCTWARSSA